MTLIGRISKMVCLSCEVTAEKYISVGKPVDPCSFCGGTMSFNRPARHATVHGGTVVYGPSRGFKGLNPDADVGGPRAYARYLKENHLEEIGNESLDTVNRHFDQKEREQEEKVDNLCGELAGEVVQELGEGLYTRERQNTNPKPLPEKFKEALENAEVDGDGIH